MTEKNFSSQHFYRNDVTHVANVATLDVEAAAKDPFEEEKQNSIKLIEQAIAECKKNPSVLGSEEFKTALKFIRENDPDLYRYEFREKIKKAKPSGVLLSDIDKDSKPESDDEDSNSSIAAELIALVMESGEFFFDEQADACFVAVDDEGIERIFQIGSKSFIEWLSYAYYQSTAKPEKDILGRSASELAIKQAGFALSGICKHDGKKQPVYLRSAPYQDGFFIFLANDRLQSIEVLPTGWRIVQKPPVKFWKPSTMQTLPVPAGKGNIDMLWDYCNIEEPDRPLVLTWILESFRPDTPFPVLALSGLQGSAKSSTHNRIRQLIDPNTVNLRAAPKTVEDIYISAGVNWVASFENISRLTPQQQDALCTLATGGGFASRTLFTNSEETVINVKRPVIINSIPHVVTAQDLTDRVINIELQPVAYREETEINAAFEQDKPVIFGALLDLFARTLAKLPEVKLNKPPRMADFTRLGEAMMLAEGSAPGAFESLFKGNRQESVSRAMESSPVAVAIREMVEDHAGTSDIVFHGTMKGLLDELSKFRQDSESWPRSARGLGDVLKRQSPALSSIGIKVIHGKVERIGKSRGVTVTIKKWQHVNIGNVAPNKNVEEEKNFRDKEVF